MSERSYSTRRPRRERRQSTASTIPGLNQTHRSWTTPGGMHCTLETTTYTSPGFASFSSSGFSGDLFETSTGPTRARTLPAVGTGLVGGALNLIDGLLSSQRQRNPRFDAPRLNGRSRRTTAYVQQPEETDSEEESDDGLAYGAVHASAVRPQSMFGKLRDRLLERSRQQTARQDELPNRPGPRRRATDRQYSRPQPFDSAYARDPSHATKPRQMSPDDAYREYNSMGTKAGQRSDQEAEEENTLRRDVDRKRRKYSEAKSRFQRASQGAMIDSVYLRSLLDEVQLQERSLARAEQRLRDAQGSRRHGRSRAAPGDPVRPPLSRQSSAQTESEYDEDEEDEDGDWHSAGFGTFFNAPRHQDPIFQVFDDFGAFDPLRHHRAFDRLFAQMGGGGFAFHDNVDGFDFHAMPGGSMPKRPPYDAGRRNRSYQQQPFGNSPTTSSRAPTHPSNALRAEEAVRLFGTYNARWLGLSPTSAEIPYPTRTLQANALSDPSTLPHAAAHAFSSEQIMQANAQVFFLLAAGIQPEISDVGLVSFNRYAPGEVKVKELVEMLKKEKVRWHSDRLGRRNGGNGAVNEALQRDERARAVFHGVCALMVFALGRT